MEKSKSLVTAQKSALQILAARLHVSSDDLERTLINTVCKPVVKKSKNAQGQWTSTERAITKEEFLAFVVVANTYGLNPLTKEIYAYPDKGAIVPIVSTDGWNKLMTRHPDYKGHSYRFSDEVIKPEEIAKPCPEWCEVIIDKRDGTQIIVREYLDEVYREAFKGEKGPIAGPWQTHTKRMLRHKTKIQGAREAFGFSGIYDEDEAERIIEAEVIPPHKELTAKPEVAPSKTKDEIRAAKLKRVRELAEVKVLAPQDYGYQKSWDEANDEALDTLITNMENPEKK